MRTLIVSDLWKPFPGGAETYMNNLANALAERGHEIHILTSYTKSRSRHSLTIANIGVNERRQEGLHEILAEIMRVGPDLIVTHHYFSGAFPELFEVRQDGKLIPSLEVVHSCQRNPNASLAVFNSRYTAARSGFREGDMVILPPAGNDVIGMGCRDCIGHIKPIPNRLWNGQWYGKGINLTYHLAKIMRDRKFLVLRGEWQDVEYIERLPNVEFMEPVDEIREFYARCRLVIMPSGSEEAGTVPLECAFNEIPCISSNVGGLPETNAGGILLCPHDLMLWVKAIESLDDSNFYTEVVIRQRRYVSSIDWTGQFDELDSKLRVLCAKSA